MVKKKPKTPSKLKKECWKIFSTIIRKKAANFQGYVTCVTCGKKLPWQESQAGHFVDGRNNTVLLDPRLVHVQCFNCNINLHGNKIRYTLFMKRTYGYSDKEIEKLDGLKNASKKMNLKDWETKLESLKKELNSLA